MSEARGTGHEWGTINVPLADVLKAPAFNTERVTQVRWGESVRVVATRPGWCKVRVASQSSQGCGYPGWVRQEYVSRCGFVNEDQCYNVAGTRAELYPGPSDTGKPQTIYYGSCLQLLAESGSWYEVQVPGQKRTLWIDKAQVSGEYLPWSQESLVTEAKRFLGTPYLWGGMSVLGIDCSGLVYVVFARHGLLLPRDAHEQFQVGRDVALAEAQAGDLVFFGHHNRISHVGMYLGGDMIIHASSKRGVCIQALSEVSDKTLMGVRRMSIE